MDWPPAARSTPPTKNVALTALVNPVADAVICLLKPASLHCTPLKVAVPLPAADPISIVVVPRSAPEPPVSARLTLKLGASPTAEVLPNESIDLTAGWVAKAEPVRDTPPGWVANTNWVAAPGLTTML